MYTLTIQQGNKPMKTYDNLSADDVCKMCKGLTDLTKASIMDRLKNGGWIYHDPGEVYIHAVRKEVEGE